MKKKHIDKFWVKFPGIEQKIKKKKNESLR